MSTTLHDGKIDDMGPWVSRRKEKTGTLGFALIGQIEMGNHGVGGFIRKLIRFQGDETTSKSMEGK
jgi:hypothetical protein